MLLSCGNRNSETTRRKGCEMSEHEPHNPEFGLLVIWLAATLFVCVIGWAVSVGTGKASKWKGPSKPRVVESADLCVSNGPPREATEIREWFVDTPEEAKAICQSAMLRFGWLPAGFGMTNGRYRVWATIGEVGE